MPAERAKVGGALAFDSGEQCGVEGVALGAVPAFARAAELPLFLRGLFHGVRLKMTLMATNTLPAASTGTLVGVAGLWQDKTARQAEDRRWLPSVRWDRLCSTGPAASTPAEPGGLAPAPDLPIQD